MRSDHFRLLLPVLVLFTFFTGCSITNTAQEQPAENGLTRYASDQIEIWLPEDYYLVDTEEYFNDIITNDPSTKEYWESNSEMIDNVEMILLRDAPDHLSYSANIFISAAYQVLPPASPPEPGEVAQSVMYRYRNSMNTSNYKELSLPSGPAASFQGNSMIGGEEISTDIYILSGNETLWIIEFATPSDIFEAESAAFREYIETFRVIGKPTLIDYYKDNSQIFHCCGGMLLIALIALIAMKVGSDRKDLI